MSNEFVQKVVPGSLQEMKRLKIASMRLGDWAGMAMDCQQLVPSQSAAVESKPWD